MSRFLPYLSLWLILVMLRQAGLAQTFVALPRSTPEAEGVSSARLLHLMDTLAASPHEFHSLMIVRHGKVIAETWWHPYRPDLKHTLYSTSKSFTSTAIGFAIQEERISLSDKVVSFFPDECPSEISPGLAAMTIRDLLIMAGGQGPDLTHRITGKDTNWVRAFLALPVKETPGTQFVYNSIDTYIAGAILQKVTGLSLLDYLRPRLFEPLGIVDADWETDPMGYQVGGWGLRLRTEDMAKLGLLYLQQGRWQDKQLLPETWVIAATSAQIIQHPDKPLSERQDSDWEQGYGYQFWRSLHGFRADGAYGQYILVLPEQDAVIAITSETQDMQGIMRLIWKYLLPAMGPAALPISPMPKAVLANKLAASQLPAPVAGPASPLEASISGKTLHFPPHEGRIGTLSLTFRADTCQVVIGHEGQQYPLSLGASHWVFGHTTRPGPNLFLTSLGHFEGLPPTPVAGAYRWTSPNTLELTLRYIESPHTERIICRFDKKTVTMTVQHSQRFGKDPQPVTGTIKPSSNK
ncbi:MAG: serine hydrolase domain-containing protein [Bacteroidia bacterium]|nr:serine hydrolase domain-containing protein [Bacteroidia bacterium]